jgi:ribosome-associated toxin RatA of RatAB toxin-antitoxin module
MPTSALAGRDYLKALGQGEVLVYSRDIKGSDVPQVVCKAVIDVPPQRVWQIVSNCNNFSRTMNRVKAAKIVSRKGNTVTCRITIDMPFPYSDMTAVTEAIHIAKKDYFSRKWKLVSGDYEVNQGDWVLKPFLGNSNRTLVVYRVQAKPKAWVPGWIRSFAQKRSLPKLINRFRKLLKH